MGRKKKSEEHSAYFNDRKFNIAKSDEARENQMIELAMDLVEHRLRNGEASSQETVHFLKLGCSKAKLEAELLKTQRELMVEKTGVLKEAKNASELYSRAMNAIKTYRGEFDSEFMD